MMDGLSNALTRRSALTFATEILAAGESVPRIDQGAAFGSSGLWLGLTREDEVSSLIGGAFLPSSVDASAPSLVVLRHDDLPALPDAQWARPWIEARVEVPQRLAYPYRVFFDRVVGVAYVLHQPSGRAVVWIRHPAEIDVRSMFTPFRIMLSWLANRVGAEILHAAGAVIGGRAIALSGASGSGKSTLALALAQAGHGIIADDCVLLEDDRLFAVYRRAKVDAWSAARLQPMARDPHPVSSDAPVKTLVALDAESAFVPQAPLSLIGLPVVGFRTPSSYEVSARRAYRLIAQDSLREVIGGSTRNRLRLARLARDYRAFRLLLAQSPGDNADMAAALVQQLGADGARDREAAPHG